MRVREIILCEKFLGEKPIALSKTTDQQSTPVISKIDESDRINNLAQYKNLLDSGVITQEEFEAKKKQLLGL